MHDLLSACPLCHAPIRAYTTRHTKNCKVARLSRRRRRLDVLELAAVIALTVTAASVAVVAVLLFFSAGGPHLLRTALELLGPPK